MASRRQLLGGGIGAAAILGGVMAKAGLSGARPVADIAAAGFIYGLPIVMSYAVLYALAIDTGSGQYRGPFNALKSDAAVLTYKDTAVVTPNSDTPYGFAALDLRAEPMVISVPAVARERYYAVQLCDGNTYNFGYIGTRATGVEAGDYLVAGPEWAGAVAAGIKGVFRSSTQFAVAIFRTQLFGVGDVGGVRAVQAGYRVQALSGFTGLGAPPAAPAVAFPKISKELIRTHFFAYLDFALRFAPAAANEMAMRAQLAQIGVGPGAAVRFADLSVTERLEVLIGLKRGKQAVDAAAAASGTMVNGWHVGAPFGDAAHTNGDWLTRAVAARAGIYGNSAEEAVYPLMRQDSAGRVLDGKRGAYTLTFAAGQLPPVDAFWSVTLYDAATRLLIRNPIDRYLINSSMLPRLKTNAHGSLTLYIQARPPRADRLANWLPAPEAPLYLVMRLYLPKPGALSILPPGRGTWRPPPVVLVGRRW